MARIKPFRPLLADQSWLETMLGEDPTGLNLNGICKLKLELEPAEIPDNESARKCLIRLNDLLQSGRYTQPQTPGLYVLQIKSDDSTTTGLCASTWIGDFLAGEILAHESTTLPKKHRMALYREKVGLETKPIMLTYRSKQDVNALINAVTNASLPKEYKGYGKAYRIWRIDEPRLIDAFVTAFAQVETCYIADGHHRLPAAAGNPQAEKDWITSWYVPSDQIHIRPFFKLTLAEMTFTKEAFFQQLYKDFYISPIPGNAPYCPDRKHRIGLFYQKCWYQLNLRPDTPHPLPDAEVLQRKVFGPLLGIEDPLQDSRIYHYREKQLQTMIHLCNDHTEAMIFTLFPVSVPELFALADTGAHLPPKTTCINPKIPFGLIVNKINTDEVKPAGNGAVNL